MFAEVFSCDRASIFTFVQIFSIRVCPLYAPATALSWTGRVLEMIRVDVVLLLCVVVSGVEGFSCSFDKNLCGFSQQSDDKFDWSRHRGRTPSGGTGPGADHTSGKGYYMYIEASKKRKVDNAVLERTVAINGDNQCLVFFYHMIGAQTGTLNVFVGAKKVFSKTGQYGFSWNKAQVPLGFAGDKMVSFEGVVGRGFQGDIAIDDVSVERCSDKATPLPTVTTQLPPSTQQSTAMPPTPPTPPTPPILSTPEKPSTTKEPVKPGTLPPAGTCGIRPNSRIVGGTNAKQGDWPWQAQLRQNGIRVYPFCGGTLIHPLWVLTANHCLSKRTAADIHVRLGAYRRNKPSGNEQDIQVAKIIRHPSYHKPKKYAYDIALLKLEKPVQLNRFVNLACIPEDQPAPADGTQCWITGFGAMSSSGWLPNYLRQASVPIVSEARCAKAYPRNLHDSMICGGYDKGGIDSCQGDSGGPLVCRTAGRYFVHGVTSWGVGCGSAGYYGVYAKVTHVLSWLNKEMNYN